jgi:hypothetical protein
MKQTARKIWGPLAALVVLGPGLWLASGLPRTLLLRNLSATPGLLVYADETAQSPLYRSITSSIESAPLPHSLRKFLLQYCEASTANVVLRSLHPEITLEEVKAIQGMEIVNFLDIQAGADANLIIDYIVANAPNLRILHLQGTVTEEGLRKICLGLPDLEDLYLANAAIKDPVPDLETGLRKLQGLTFDNCELGREFLKNLEGRPDVKIARQ